MLQLVQQQKIYPHEVVMNLPAIATEFLDVFIGLYAQSPNPSPMPRIHVYAFSTDESNPINDILHRAAGVLQCAPELLRYLQFVLYRLRSFIPFFSAGPDYAGHVVRDVAPKKVMVCLSFTLPVEVRVEIYLLCVICESLSIFLGCNEASFEGCYGDQRRQE